MSGRDMTAVVRKKLAEYREKRRREVEEWRGRPPELEVRSEAHAVSAEVLEFCLEHLRQGRGWSELRYRLGIPHPLDRRWAIVKQKCVDMLLPSSDEEALSRSMANRALLLQRLESLVEEIEDKISASDSLGKMDFSIMWTRTKMDALEILLREASKDLDEYAEVQKLKRAENKNSGPSIIVQNNFHIPRPKLDSVKDVLPVMNRLSDIKAVLDEGGGEKLRPDGQGEDTALVRSEVHRSGGGDGIGEKPGDS